MLKKKASFKKKKNGNGREKKRNESLYEKRVREYKENTENKFVMQRRKELGVAANKDDKENGTLTKGQQEESIQKTAKELLKPTTIKLQDANAKLFENIHSILKHSQNSGYMSMKKAKSLKTFNELPHLH